MATPEGDALDAAIHHHDSQTALPPPDAAFPGLKGIGAAEPPQRRTGRKVGKFHRPTWGKLGQHEPDRVRVQRKAVGLANKTGKVSMRGVLPGTGSPPRYGRSRTIMAHYGFGRTQQELAEPFSAHVERKGRRVRAAGAAVTSSKPVVSAQQYGGGRNGAAPGGVGPTHGYGGNGTHHHGEPHRHAGSEATGGAPAKRKGGDVSSLRHRRRRELARKLRATQKALFKEQELRVDAQLELEVSMRRWQACLQHNLCGCVSCGPFARAVWCTLYGARAGSCCAGNECWQ